MRRSGAPSQLRGNAAKKPRFMPPGPARNDGAPCLDPQPEPSQPSPPPIPALKNVLLNKVQRCLSSGDAPAASDAPVGSKALARVLGAAVPQGECKENNIRSMPDFPEPEESVNKDRRSPPLNTHASCTTTAHYYSVIWCKASSRKHKRWEGDAVLVARGRTVVLKDMEGRDIGRGSGYKASELESLCEGQTLMVGGKQIEVMGVISDQDYAKGRCFQDAAVEIPAESPTVSKTPAYRPVSKSFTKPALKGGALTDSELDKPICKPRYDPNAPGALVMPRPTADHQWQYNKSGAPLVDVVIDPHLTNHLRPHQKEGVVFLYECLMGMRLAGRCGAILADEMGLGKTLQCVCVLWTLLRQGPYGGRPVMKRALVVCPGSLVKNWAAEFNKWRVEDFVSSPLCSVLVISYEMLLRSVDRLKELDFGVLICDEGHRFIISLMSSFFCLFLPRVVLVSNHTQTLDLLQDVCDQIGYKWCRLDGQTPVGQRQKIVDSFNSPHSSSFLLLLSSKAGGVGLNLIGASHLVLYDIDWNPANDIQAMARVWRDGQKKTVHIYRFLTTGSIEEKIYQRQVSKQGLSGTVVDLTKKAEHISFSAEELRDLFRFDPNTTCLTHDLLNCKCSGDGNTPGSVKESSEDTGRSCQLGRQADNAISVPQRVSMSELMHWRHFSGAVQSYGDIYLNQACNHITYAFQSTSKSKTTV